MIDNRDFEGMDFSAGAGGGVRIRDYREQKTMNNLVTAGETYTPERDVVKKLEDGRQIQVAVAGVPMNRAEAGQIGLIDEAGEALDKNGVIEEPAPEETGGEEKAAAAPAANKAKTPKSNK